MEFKLNEEYGYEIERAHYEWQGFTVLLLRFSTVSEDTIDDQKFQQLIKQYINSYTEYSIIFEECKRKAVPEKYLNEDFEFNFENSTYILKQKTE